MENQFRKVWGFLSERRWLKCMGIRELVQQATERPVIRAAISSEPNPIDHLPI